MVEFLIKRLQRGGSELGAAQLRRRFGMLGSVAGVVANLLLAALKGLVGILSGSVSIIADAFNNLTDMAASIVSLVGFHAAGRPADEEHPFGHGRFEYIAAFVMSLLMVLVGFEFAQVSVSKIIAPEPVTFHALTAAVLAGTIAIKLLMSRFYRAAGLRINSAALSAAAKDSANDALATLAALIAVVSARFTDLPVDGYIGALISLFILWSGIKLARETMTPLLGAPPSAELVEGIRECMLKCEGITGVHDLLVHDYGEGRIMASAHAEVPSDADIMAIHDVIDNAEREISRIFGIQFVIHLDPVDVNDARTNALRELVAGLVHDWNESYSIHDFRIVTGHTHTNLVFDLAVPLAESSTNGDLRAELDARVREVDRRLFTVITVDRACMTDPQK